MLRFFVVFFILIFAEQTLASQSDKSETLQWREDREKKLKEPYNWLSLTGLFWLEQGSNSLKVSKSSQAVFSYDSKTKEVQLLNWKSNGAKKLLINEKEVKSDQLPIRVAVESEKQKADEIMIGDLKMHVISRPKGTGIRVRDPSAETRTQFKGLEWYPYDDKWRIEGRFVPASEKQSIKIDDITGGSEEWETPGYVEANISGQSVKLRALKSGDDFFFVFRDQTSGKGTYPAARFLYSKAPKKNTQGEVVVLDFNRAYNPPCAFTPHATCPLPPRENWLKFPVEAGEKYSGDH